MYTPDLTWVWLAAVLMAGGLQLLVAGAGWLWHIRRAVGGLAMALYIMSIPLLASTHFKLGWCVLLGLGTMYATVNAARLVVSRFEPAYLRHTVPFNVWLLYGFLTLAALGAEAGHGFEWPPHGSYVIGGLLVVSIGVGCALHWRLRWARRHYRLGDIQVLTKERDLPTVTLAVTARNETHALNEMLQLAIKSDYPKLEILVLDDCSQDATAQVIRGFAHDGVRFVQGKVPADGWLGKNYACATLAQEASGDLIIFAGVDTHFEPQSIGRLVSYTIQQKAHMVSALPYRRVFDFVPTFFDQLGNFWQLLWPVTKRHLPISSPCWAIWSDSLRRLGGFGAYKNSIFPEVHFARALLPRAGYRFVVANEWLGITTRKLLSSQFATATRTFYPMLKRRPAMVFFASLAIATVLLLPFGVLVCQLLRGQFGVVEALALLAVGALASLNALVTRQITLHAWWVGALNFPIAASLQLLLFNWSMLQFEFGEVNWKGRNVCYPVLESIPMEEFAAALRADPHLRRGRRHGHISPR